MNNHDMESGNEDVHHEEDLDLDLSDLMSEEGHDDSIGERLRAAERRAESKGIDKSTPVNVTASGRHEIVDSEDHHDEDFSLSDVAEDGAIVGAADADESTLGDGSFPGPASRIEQELDMAGVAPSDPIEGGPMTMAAFDMENAAAGDTKAAAGQEYIQRDTEIPQSAHDVPEVGETLDSGPMTAAALEMDAENVSTLTNGQEVEEVSEAEENLSSADGSTLLDTDSDSTQTDSDTDVPPSASVETDSAETPSEGGVTPVPTNEDELDLGNEGAEPSDELDLGGTDELDAPEEIAEEAASEIEEPTEPQEEVAEEDPTNNTDEGEAGMVSDDAASVEVAEEHTQQQEVSTVGDDAGGPLGRGLDVGTANLVASRMDEEGGIEFFPARNAFLDVPEDPYTLKMLKGQGVPYIKRENKLFILGEDAFELANIFNREMRRPMKHGLISPTDVDAMPMEVELLKKILGPPRADGEMVYYSVPADPIDSTMNIVYHTNIVNGLLERLGYRGQPFNEGLAVVFAELSDDEFTGIGISCGGGMVNVCVAFRSMPVISFSTSKGGDWIDQQAAQVMGCAASKITAAKERGVDINAPKTPEEEAIVIYYRHLIKYSLDNIVKKFESAKDIPNFPKPVPIAVSGGTSKVGGFVDVFKDEFSKMADRFPIKVSEIRKADDQLNATSKGCLLAALSHED
ncbi:hypothetical protein OAU50_00770 [Planctomycetota bacterium]|nr:hypothetical protein [Planctomycetota bacterium]